MATQVPQHGPSIAEQKLHPVGGLLGGGVGEGADVGGFVGIGVGPAVGPLAATHSPLFQFFPIHRQAPAGQSLPSVYFVQSMGTVGADVG